MTGFDRKLRELIDRYYSDLIWAALLLLSVLIRLWLIPVQMSDDYEVFLRPWVENYAAVSIGEALRMDISNYYVPYNLLLILTSRLPLEPYIPIAFFSVAADYGIARICAGLAARFTENEQISAQCFLLVLFLPFVFVNSALWKQCDSIYVFFILWSMEKLYEEKPVRSFILLGIAFSFKLQTVFVLPFYIMIYFMKKNHSVLYYLLVPLVYGIAGLPAVIAGKPFKSVYLVYKEQIKEPGGIVRNLSNVWYLGLPPEETAKRPAIMLTIAALMVLFLLVYRKKEKLTDAKLFFVCGFTAWTCVMFLPGMHERYDYIVTLIISVYALMTRNKKLLAVALALNIIDVMNYSYFLFYWSLIEPSKLTIWYIAAYAFTGWELLMAEDGHEIRQM